MLIGFYPCILNLITLFCIVLHDAIAAVESKFVLVVFITAVQYRGTDQSHIHTKLSNSLSSNGIKNCQTPDVAERVPSGFSFTGALTGKKRFSSICRNTIGLYEKMQRTKFFSVKFPYF